MDKRFEKDKNLREILSILGDAMTHAEEVILKAENEQLKAQAKRLRDMIESLELRIASKDEQIARLKKKRLPR